MLINKKRKTSGTGRYAQWGVRCDEMTSSSVRQSEVFSSCSSAEGFTEGFLKV
jgi:hypothetical protein